MNNTLQEFGDTSPPGVEVDSPVFHPNGGGSIVGHVGTDHERGTRFAMLPRNRTLENGEQHYFRKYEGYAVSRQLLDRFERGGVDRVCIVERDGECNVYEFERQQFKDGSFVAYDAESNSIVESEPEYLNNQARYDDPQQVLAVDDALHVWQKSKVSIYESRQ